MSNQYPQQQPGWGAPQQPGWGAPMPQPPKKSNAGKIIGFGCLGVIGLFVLLGIVAALVGGGDSGSDSKSATSQTSAPANTGKDEAKDEEEAPSKAKEEKAPVAITAKKTAFAKTILAQGSDYTSVLVTVTNNGSDTISVNPLYFAITDADGTKHTVELGVDEKQIGTVDLAPGENIAGTVTGKGAFTAKYVTYTDGFLGDSIRADVS